MTRTTYEWEMVYVDSQIEKCLKGEVSVGDVLQILRSYNAVLDALNRDNYSLLCTIQIDEDK